VVWGLCFDGRNPVVKVPGKTPVHRCGCLSRTAPRCHSGFAGLVLFRFAGDGGDTSPAGPPRVAGGVDRRLHRRMEGVAVGCPRGGVRLPTDGSGPHGQADRMDKSTTAWTFPAYCRGHTVER